MLRVPLEILVPFNLSICQSGGVFEYVMLGSIAAYVQIQSELESKGIGRLLCGHLTGADLV